MSDSYKIYNHNKAYFVTFQEKMYLYCIKLKMAEVYYIYTDYLCSPYCLTDATGTVTEEHSFDPWGRQRNPTDWTYNHIPVSNIIDRGFTGHEHLPEFALINMNGRMYDPVLGTFISPDNYVQFPDFSQSLNRYSYALNNPLVYVDEDGEWLWIPIMIAMAAISGDMMGDAYVNYNLGNYSQGFWTGAAISVGTSLIGMGTGFVASNIVEQGAIAGGIFGGMSGAVVGGISGGISSSIMGGDFNQGFGSGALIGGISGMIMGGLQGYTQAKKSGLNPWTGRSPYKDVSLEVPFVGQDLNSMDCLLANSEMLEKYYGGTRTIENFRDILNKLPEGATIADYYSVAGFKIMGEPQNAIHVIRTMEVNKFPTTITTYEGKGSLHNSTITRVRMWTPKSKAVFWVNDTVRGMNYRWSQNALYKVIWDRFVIGGIK